MLSTNQIAVFFDHQYLWKQSINTSDFLHEDNYQRKVGSETTTFVWVWPVVPHVQSDYSILRSSISLQRISGYHRFFAWRPPPKEETISDYYFLLGVVSCASGPVRPWCPLIVNITGRNQSIPYIFCMKITINRRKDLRLPVLVACGQLWLSPNYIAGFSKHGCLWEESVDTLRVFAWR